MPTELEQKFYDTFEIKPKIDYDYKTTIQNVTKTGYWFDKEYLIKMFNDNQKFKVIQVKKNINYPNITAEKLLEMICIMNKHIHKHNENALCPITGESCKEIKNYMLRLLIFNQPLLEKIFIKEIQQLFKD